MDNYNLSVGVVIIHEEKVLLVKHNYGSAKGKYLNPGGFLKSGELPFDAAKREVFEETGVNVSPIGMIAIRCSKEGGYLVLAAEYIDGAPRTDSSENDEALFMDVTCALKHPLVTDTAKKLISTALENKYLKLSDVGKSRIMFCVDDMCF